MQKKQLIKYSVLGVALFAAGYVGYSISEWRGLSHSQLAPVEFHENSDQYKYINPLLFSRTDKSLYAQEFKKLYASLDDEIASSTESGYADKVSVYYRDLNSSHWTGINEDEKYDPSSMLKVAVLIAYLKDIEKEPDLLNHSLYYDGSNYSGQYYVPNKPIPAGMYTVQELLKFMIIDSDNEARQVLVDYKTQDFDDVYKDFRLPLPKASSSDYMSARSYSVLFRSLFNATYLPWGVSEQVLALLSNTSFTQGLVAGIPAGVAAAHKFGEHTYIQPDGTVISRELHDCGIVYYPDHPYFICVMTKGTDFPKLQTVIADVSRIVYNYIDDTNTHDQSTR